MGRQSNPNSRNATPKVTKVSTPSRLDDKIVNEIESKMNSIKISASNISLNDIGGLKEQLKTLNELITIPIRNKDKIAKLGLHTPRGILLYGFPGTGKTMSMRAIQAQLENECYFIRADGGELFSRNSTELEKRLNSLFIEANKKSPSVIFIDDIDLLCASKRNASEQEKRILSSLFAIFDELQETNVIIVGSTNKPDSLDSSLRRPGRFDVEIEFTVPLSFERVDILNKIMSKVNHVINEETLNKIAESAYSFTGADLNLSCRKAVLLAVCKKDFIDEDDLRSALKTVKPSAMREITLEVPPIFWSDIGGMNEVKALLKQAVVLPLKHPEAFKRMGISPPKGVLMYGPPGCSKTMVGKALATESKLNFISIKGPELFSKWVGESERAVRELFRKAKQAAPAIIFFDEIDALAAERGAQDNASTVGDRVLAQLLTEMDGVESLDGVIIVAATNRPDKIDKALLRRGRLGSIVYVPLPNDETRREILSIKMKQMPIEIENEENIREIIDCTQGYSGAEMTALCEESALIALDEDINSQLITLHHFRKALMKIHPRTTSEMIHFYQKFNAKQSNFYLTNDK